MGRTVERGVEVGVTLSECERLELAEMSGSHLQTKTLHLGESSKCP